MPKIRMIPGLLLTFKVGLTIMSVVIFSIMLLNFVTYLKYDSILDNVVGSRFLVIADDLRQTVSNGLDLGLSLKELQTTQAVIEGVKKSDPQILSISVFAIEGGDTGKILYNTRHAGIGGSAPSVWINTLKSHASSKYWILNEDNVGSVGVTIVNNFKEPIGGIVVRYDQKYLMEKNLFFAKHLVFYSLSAIAISFIVVLLLVSFVLRFVGTSFGNMHHAVEAFVTGTKVKLPPPNNEIEREFSTMFSATASLWEQLGKVETMMANGKQVEDEHTNHEKI